MVHEYKRLFLIVEADGFDSNNLNEQWDGVDPDGKRPPDGVYIYLIEFRSTDFNTGTPNKSKTSGNLSICNNNSLIYNMNLSHLVNNDRFYNNTFHFYEVNISLRFIIFPILSFWTTNR